MGPLQAPFRLKTSKQKSFQKKNNWVNFKSLCYLTLCQKTGKLHTSVFYKAWKTSH